MDTLRASGAADRCPPLGEPFKQSGSPLRYGNRSAYLRSNGITAFRLIGTPDDFVITVHGTQRARHEVVNARLRRGLGATRLNPIVLDISGGQNRCLSGAGDDLRHAADKPTLRYLTW
jgi:hypothetical protein